VSQAAGQTEARSAVPHADAVGRLWGSWDVVAFGSRVSVVCTVAAYLSLLAAILAAPPLVNLFVLSGMPSLPIWWFVAVALAAMAAFLQWISANELAYLSALQFIVFVASLWTFPHLAGVIPEAGQGWQYSFWGQVSYVLENGHTDATVWVGHNWPVPAILWSTLANVLGQSDPQFFVAQATWVARLIYLLPMYLLLRYLLDNPKARWAGMYVFTVGLWSTQPGLTMQALGYLLFVFMAVVVIAQTRARKDHGSPRVMYILIGAALVLTHLLSALWGLGMAASLYLLKTRQRGRRYLPLVLLAVVFGTWVIYVGGGFVDATLPNAFSQALTLGFLSDSAQQAYGSSGSAAWRLTILLKTALMVALLAFAGVAGILRLIRRESSSTDVALMGAAGAMVILTLLVGSSYSPSPEFKWEILHRLFLFLLPLIAYFSVVQIGDKVWTISLLLLLMILAPLSYASHYAPEYYAYVSSQAVEKYKFVISNVDQANIVTVSPALLALGTREDQYRLLSTDYAADWEDESNPAETLVLLGDQERRLERHFAGRPEFLDELDQRLVSDPNWALIYTSGTERIFRGKE